MYGNNKSSQVCLRKMCWANDTELIQAWHFRMTQLLIQQELVTDCLDYHKPLNILNGVFRRNKSRRVSYFLLDF